jgi:hypothetical protein
MNPTLHFGKTVIRIAVIWGLVFGAVPPGGAQEKTKAQEAAKKTDAVAQLPDTQAQTLKTVESPARVAEKSSRGPNEGIKVHGYWTLDVRNPDGTLSSHIEFENSLTSLGAGFLLDVLNGKVDAIGRWLVQLSPSICDLGNGASSTCLITQENPPSAGFFGPLTVSIPSTGPDTGKLVLKGTARAAAAGAITGVNTLFIRASDPKGFLNQFTSADISVTPVAVQPGQSIDVTVKISFS